jgi:antitoxin component YwqK of YwqJK toxin-antitoxin module
MPDEKKYKNGQKANELIGNKLTWYFKNGKIKAIGIFENNLMEGEWIFYRETGQLWQVGNFKTGKKNGTWIRYDKNDQLEYHETFEDDKIVKNRK